MSSTTPNGVARVLRPWRSVRSIPAIMERLDRLEDAVGDANRRIDELQTSVAAVGAVRTDVRDLTEHVTEQLNEISASLSAARWDAPPAAEPATGRQG